MTSQSPEALTKSLQEAENHLRELRFKLSSNQLKDVRDVRLLRAEIARLKTALHLKTRAAS